jgi:carboxyl-terminal processing protease
VLRKWIGALDEQLMAAQRTTTRGWIVDLRGNPGGNIWPMLAGVSSLLSDGEVMGFQSARHTDAVTISGDRVLLGGAVRARGSSTVPKSNLPVAVLVSDGTASSGEGVAIAFAGQRNSQSFGEPTAGLSTANTSIRLRDGAVVNLTSAVDVDRTGRPYGGPVVPQVHSAEAAIDAAGWLKADEPSP